MRTRNQQPRERRPAREAAAAAANAPRATRGNGRHGSGWWLAAATLALPAFIVVPVALDAFRLPQRMVAEWLALLSLLVLAPRLGRLEPAVALASPALRAVLPLLLVAAGGLLWSAHPAHVRDGVIDLAIGAAALVGWSLALDAPALRRLLDATLVPAVALSLLAILQLHRIWDPLQVAADLSGERSRLTAFAGNPGDLAALLVLPCLVAQSRLGEAGRRRWGWAVALGLGVYALAASQTLTSLSALLIGSMALWAVLLPRRALLAGAGVALMGGLLLLAVPALRARLAGVAGAASSGELNYMLSGRLDGWRVAIELLRQHPLAGVGQGAYRAEFAPAKLRLLASGVPFFRGHVNPSFANAHDEYLEVAADLGWPGLLALVWGLGVLVHAVRRSWRRLAADDRGLLVGGFVALALLALAYFPLRLAPAAFGWLAWLAWLVAAADPTAGEAAAAAATAPRARAGGAPRWLRATLAALLALALGAQTWRLSARVVASVYVRAVQQQMALAAARGAAPGGLIEGALRVLERAHRLDPAAIEPLAFRGDVLLVAHRDEDADLAYRRAIAHEPRGETLFNHGLLLWQEGRGEEAVVELRRGVALMPRLRAQVPPGAAALVEAAPIAPLPVTRRAS